jgi:hypothetical protein
MSTTYAQQLLPAYTECDQNPIPSDYDTLRPDDPDAVKTDFYTKHKLSINKDHLNKEFDAWRVPEERRVLMTAMAMQETRHMDVEERDKTKDCPCPPDNLACNYFRDNATIFNLSKDLIQKTGYYNGHKGQFQFLTNDQFAHLCTEEGLHDAVGILSLAFDLWGVEDTLAFVRGGGDAFDPGNSVCRTGQPGQWRNYCHFTNKPQNVSDGVVDYLCCIKRMIRYLDEDQWLMRDGRRPDLYCQHI